jgi:pimeloyl-ACP methyl ester carboxylesterase
MARSSTRRAGNPLPISSRKRAITSRWSKIRSPRSTADVDATKQALAKQDGRTVLVGHSWAGVVITQAGDDPKVSALVYVSAFAPDVGESLAALASSGPATEGGAAIHPDAKGNLYIDPKVFPSRSRPTCRRRSPRPWRIPSCR